MKSGPFDFWSCATGCSGWTFICALLSTFGLVGYYSSLLRHRLPDWLMVGVFMVPITLVLLIAQGVASDRVVAASHLIAASWFMTLALGMELGLLLGYEPKESEVFRIFAHLGWTFAWAGIYRRAKQSRKRILEEGPAPDGSPPSNSPASPAMRTSDSQRRSSSGGGG